MTVAISLFLLAVALAMDAFAAAIAHGAATRGRARHALRVSAAFGLAQGAMPLIGWSLGMIAAGYLAALDHWIALVVLGGLGARMIVLAMGEEEESGGRALAGAALLAAAVATSIDAAIAGVTLPAMGAPVLLACAVIGLVTAAISWVGVHVGAGVGARLGARAEIAGGLILIALGVKIFVEHRYFGG